jgi:hypothetical protein
VAWAQFLHQLSVVGQTQGTESTEEDVDLAFRYLDLAYHADSKADRKDEINDDSIYEVDVCKSRGEEKEVEGLVKNMENGICAEQIIEGSHSCISFHCDWKRKSPSRNAFPIW